MLNLKDIYTGNLPWLVPNTIYLVKHGSQAYGMATENSDLDIKGVCIPPKEYYLGVHPTFEQSEFSNKHKNPEKKDEIEAVIYELRKFIKLAAECNPNIIEVLWVDPSDYIIVHPLAEKLIDNRHKFISKKAKFTFSGYAHAQLKRIKNHRAWLLNPPKARPTRSEFGLPEMRKLSKSNFGAIEKIVEDNAFELSEEVVVLWQKERAYNNALSQWKQYQNWKATRNKDRFVLEEKYGFDTKHGAHLVRLMKMCKEILETGEVKVKRPDADELLAIRAGAWKFDELIEWAEKMEQECEELYKTSQIPHKVDHKFIDNLSIEILEEVLTRGF